MIKVSELYELVQVSHHGARESWMDFTLSGHGEIPSTEIWYPKNVTLVWLKTHFIGFITMPYCFKHSNTCLTWLIWSCIVQLTKSMSSMEMQMNRKSCKIWSINLWNVWYAFHKLNRACTKSNNPNGATIAVFGMFFWLHRYLVLWFEQLLCHVLYALGTYQVS